MLKKTSVKYAEEGHQEILETIREKYQLDFIETFKIRHTACGLAKTQTNEKVFVKVKGYQKNQLNEGRFRRAVTSNRMAGKIKSDIMPQLIEFKAFEHDNVLWITSLSAYGGEPISQGHFYDGDDAAIDHQLIKRLRDSIGVIQKSPTVSVYYSSHDVSRIIAEVFGRQVNSIAPEWTSAHCDFHWGNILEGGSLVDWDMFALAPKGFDAASIVLFSASNIGLFERMYQAFFDILDDDSARVATLLAAARILQIMSTNTYSNMRVFEPNIRQAVRLIVSPDIR